MTRAVLASVCLLSLAGCERYDRPNRPFPAEFEARLLDGGRWHVDVARGRPWVVNLWVPG